MRLGYAFVLVAIGIAISAPVSPSRAFDTTPWAGGSLNYGGLASTTRAYAKAASAEARANAIEGPSGKRGTVPRIAGIDRYPGNACIVNVGGAIANSVGDGAVNIVEFTGDIVQICR